MKSFEKYIDAENYAKEVSARDLKSISIVHLFNEQGKNYRKDRTHKKDFTVMDTKDEWFYGIQHVMLITNYTTPFEVRSESPKSGLQIQGFPTKELAMKSYDELKRAGYHKNLFQRDLTPEQYFDEYVKPYERCKAFSEEYRQTLIAA